jgi:alkylated DNA repair protein (DNA oxidative demethylase)
MPHHQAGGRTVPAPFMIRPGLRLWRGLIDRAGQAAILAAVRAGLAAAPPFRPVMPRTGRPFSVEMTNFGRLGWVSDRQGYRYQPLHPATGNPWPAIPESVLSVWRSVADWDGDPEACLVNLYGPQARMGLHQDRDEIELSAPVVSISLGDDALFRAGGATRGGPTDAVRLHSGDVLAMGGESRLCHHGVARIFPGTSTLLGEPGRINLTLRRVTPLEGLRGQPSV